MRIVENDSRRIVLRDGTLLLSVISLFVAVATVAIGAAKGFGLQLLVPAALFALFGLMFLRSSRIVVDKVARSCTVRRREMWRLTEDQLPFDHIEDVSIDIFMGGKWGHVVTCRLILASARGPVPLSSGFQPGLEWFVETRRLLVAAIFADRPKPPDFDFKRAQLDSQQFVEGITVLRRPR